MKQFWQGNYKLLESDRLRVAIIGPRNSSSQSRIEAMQLGQETVNRGHIVVSGLAHGIDTFAHMGGIKRSIAVVNNIVKPYPQDNLELLRDIYVKNSGLVLSPYDTDVGARGFLDRDKMIVEICDEIHAVGIKEEDIDQKGGTNYTTRYAIYEKKKPVFFHPP
jgi:DNA processing protein